MKTVRVSPQKMRRFARVLSGRRVSDAEEYLLYIPTKPAKMLLKLLRSAKANASHNFEISPDNLIVKTIQVGDGVTLKRMLPRARGRADVLHKRTSHVNLHLADVSGETKDIKGKRSDIVVKQAGDLSREELRENRDHDTNHEEKNIESAPNRSAKPRVKEDSSAIQKKGGE